MVRTLRNTDAVTGRGPVVEAVVLIDSGTMGKVMNLIKSVI